MHFHAFLINLYALKFMMQLVHQRIKTNFYFWAVLFLSTSNDQNHGSLLLFSICIFSVHVISCLFFVTNPQVSLQDMTAHQKNKRISFPTDKFYSEIKDDQCVKEISNLLWKLLTKLYRENYYHHNKQTKRKIKGQ